LRLGTFLLLLIFILLVVAVRDSAEDGYGCLLVLDDTDQLVSLNIKDNTSNPYSLQVGLPPTGIYQRTPAPNGRDTYYGTEVSSRMVERFEGIQTTGNLYYSFTETTAAVSPEGSRIAWFNEFDYTGVVNISTPTRRLLAQIDLNDIDRLGKQPLRWSADGQYLLATWLSGTHATNYLLSKDLNLVSVGWYEKSQGPHYFWSDAAWAPTGHRLAQVVGSAGEFRLIIGTPEQPEELSFLLPYDILTLTGYWLEWSPSGEHIVLAHDDQPCHDCPRYIIFGLDGSVRGVVGSERNFIDNALPDIPGAWSRDGRKWIGLFDANTELGGRLFTLRAVDVATGQIEDIDREVIEIEAISPSGLFFTYRSFSSEGDVLQKMFDLGRVENTLTAVSMQGWWTLSPDNNWVAYMTELDEATRTQRLIVQRIDGSQRYEKVVSALADFSRMRFYSDYLLYIVHRMDVEYFAKVHLLDLKTGKSRLVIDYYHPRLLNDVDWSQHAIEQSPDGRILAMWNPSLDLERHYIDYLDLATGLVQRSQPHFGFFFPIRWSPDGSFIATVDYDSSAQQNMVIVLDRQGRFVTEFPVGTNGLEYGWIPNWAWCP
jgi:hypothetical protein